MCIDLGAPYLYKRQKNRKGSINFTRKLKSYINILTNLRYKNVRYL